MLVTSFWKLSCDKSTDEPLVFGVSVDFRGLIGMLLAFPFDFAEISSSEPALFSSRADVAVRSPVTMLFPAE